jgi:hypothetical protein
MCLSFDGPLNRHDLRLLVMALDYPHDTICEIKIECDSRILFMNIWELIFSFRFFFFFFVTVIKKCLRDCWIWRATRAAACQFLFLLFSCHYDATRCDKWRLRWCEHCQIVILLMNIISRTLHFHTTLETSIITIIWCISNT